MGDLATLLPAGGVGGLLTLVILYLLNANRLDRSDYREAIDRAEKRADDAEARGRATQQLLDEARAARRAAEDNAAHTTREVTRLRERVEELTAEVAQLRTRVGAP